MIKSSVLNEEMRRKAQGSSSQSEVLVTENRRRSQKKGRKKSKNTRMWSFTIVTKQGIYRSIISCGKKENKGKKGKLKEKDHDDDDNRVTTTTGDDLSVNLVSDESIWIIDSGGTLHVTLRKKFFTSYTLDDF
ncbi:hypothetical protein CR513_10417, partial [Mucuna pruriens]